MSSCSKGLPVDRCRHKVKGQPLCMAQYYRLFTSYRRPGVAKDEVISRDSTDGDHIVVACKNQVCLLYMNVYRMCMYVVYGCLLYMYVCCICMSVVYVCLLYMYVCCICMSVVYVCLLYVYVCHTSMSDVHVLDQISRKTVY